MVFGSLVTWSFLLSVSERSRFDFWNNTERIFSHVSSEFFFVVSKFGVLANLFRQGFNFCNCVRVTPKKTLFHYIFITYCREFETLNFFLADVSILLVIQGFPTSFRCSRLIRSSKTCLLIVLAIIFTNYSKTSSKILRFEGKLFATSLPSFWFSSSEKASVQ